MALRILSELWKIVLIILVLSTAAVIADSQLELKSGDMYYSPVLNSNDSYTYGNIDWIVYRIEIEHNKDNKPIKVQIENHGEGNFNFNWRMDKKRSSRTINFYINNDYKKSCNSDKWSKEPIGFIVNESDELELQLTSNNLRGSWVEIAFPKQETIGSIDDDVEGHKKEGQVKEESSDSREKDAHGFVNESYIPAGASLSSIMETLKKPCKSILIGENANLQEIINAMEQLQNDQRPRNKNVFGKILYLKNGEYPGSIEIRAENFSIKSEPGAEAVIKSSNSDQFNILIDNTNGVHIDGICLKDGMYGIHIFSSNNCTLNNNSIDDFSYAGILLVNSTNNEIQNNIVKSGVVKSNGVQLDSSKEFMIQNNSVYVSNFEYYFDNQSGISEPEINNVYLRKATNGNYLDIYDNQIEYYCNDSMICQKICDNNCVYSPLATKNNRWWLE